MTRIPSDLEVYEKRARSGTCFVCAMLSGDLDYRHEIVYEDDAHIAFMNRYPTMPGYVLACPKAHVQHILRDLDEPAYLRLMAFVRLVGLAVEATVDPERTYILSLGSQQGNDHVHWHIAPLPRGVPYEQQQYHALMAEKGILAMSAQERSGLAGRIREQIRCA